MTQFSPSPSNPYVPSATRTRLRWDNLAVLCAALAVVGGVTTTIMSQTSPKPKVERSAVAPAAATPVALSMDADAATTITAATLEDAASLVAEARDFISQGRWEEAADRLASIDASMRPTTDADTAERELEAAQGAWTRLDAQLRTQVETKDWADARVTLDELAKLAPLGDEQLELRDRVDVALAPAAATTATKPAATTAKPAAAAATATPADAASTTKPAATTGGGAAATTPPKPAAATPKPVAATPKPVAAKPKPAAGAGSTTSVGGITITMPAGTGAGAGGGQDIDAAELEQLLGMVTTG